ncbi:hypothetical protein KC19_2G156900 [Ceratodon purpureus]|uniref:Uncharacterized protein n=1 Tax=Ceratodon purpureus TaxID=3225 RepID=A0A8T0IW41_CERPU|nr:hypothetical protein KC19_2G156900 [Ceratodon purpureus]
MFLLLCSVGFGGVVSRMLFSVMRCVSFEDEFSGFMRSEGRRYCMTTWVIQWLLS